MGRSPKASSHRSASAHQKNKRRRDSSSPDSDNDRQRYQRRHHDDNKPQSSKKKMSSQEHSSRRSITLDPRVKQEPMTDDDSRRPRPNKSFEQRRNPREQDTKSHQWGKPAEKDKSKEAPVEKEKPNFGLSGALLKDTNTYKGFVIKYSEPIEARKPKRRWRLYVFKGEQVNSKTTISLHQ